MRELQKGLWHWEAPHPEWKPSAGGPDGWGRDVSCYAIDDGERLLLFDPLALPAELEELAGSRATAVVLTNAWHERDARDLAERLGAQVFVPPPDGPGRLEGQPYAAGDRLPVGVEARPGTEPPFDRYRRLAYRQRHRPDALRPLDPRGPDARAGPRAPAPTARAAGRDRAPDARGADRPRRPRARAHLTPTPARAPAPKPNASRLPERSISVGRAGPPHGPLPALS